jgi:hypothetical protein
MVVGHKWQIVSALLGILFINGCGQMMAQRNGTGSTKPSACADYKRMLAV